MCRFHCMHAWFRTAVTDQEWADRACQLVTHGQDPSGTACNTGGFVALEWPDYHDNVEWVVEGALLNTRLPILRRYVLGANPPLDEAIAQWHRALYTHLATDPRRFRRVLNDLMNVRHPDWMCARYQLWLKALVDFPWAAVDKSNLSLAIVERILMLGDRWLLARQGLPPLWTLTYKGVAPSNPRQFWYSFDTGIPAHQCHFSAPGMQAAIDSERVRETALLMTLSAEQLPAKLQPRKHHRDAMWAWLGARLTPQLLDRLHARWNAEAKMPTPWRGSYAVNNGDAYEPT